MHIVITGASSGLGRELAKILSADGHSLSLCGRKADKLVESIARLRVHLATIRLFVLRICSVYTGLLIQR